MVFDEFFRDTFRRLVKIVMQQGGSFEDAEDAAAQAAVEVWQRWDELRDPVAYACRAAITNFHKARQRDEQRLRRTVSAQRLDPAVPHDHTPGDIHDSDRVVRLLSGLPKAQGEAMAYTVDGFSPAEVAGKVGKTSAAVRANLKHARRTLAARMADSPDWDVRDRSQSRDRDRRRSDDQP